jgi:anti-sigma regulatory factor (Ser/Thr protein kinase)
MMAPSEPLSLHVPCDRDAPATVREALAAELHYPSWVLGDVMLVASELVSNAVLHSGCLDHHLLDVDVRFEDALITVSVHDPGLSGVSARLAAAEGAAGGWGLRIVGELAERWGAERLDGYRVWAEIPSGDCPVAGPTGF